MLRRLILMLWLVVGMSSVTALHASTNDADIAVAAAGDTPPCPADTHSHCIVTETPDPAVIRERLGDETYLAWVDDDIFTVAYRGEARYAQVIYSFYEMLTPIPDTDLWTVSFRFADMQQAVISYAVAVNGEPPESYNVWRGDDAPPAPPQVETLQGRLLDTSRPMLPTSERRDLTIYLPPNYDENHEYPVIYMADGQSVAYVANIIEAGILHGTLPKVVLVGVHSGDHRWEEYLPGEDDERFRLHEQFFTQQVRSWVESTFAVSTERDGRAVMGYSNGGVFAAAMGVSHPDIYGHAFPFSAGMDPLPHLASSTTRPDVSYYFVAGKLEDGFYRATSQLAEDFRQAGAPVQFHAWVSGHDFVMWAESLPDAIAHAFGS